MKPKGKRGRNWWLMSYDVDGYALEIVVLLALGWHWEGKAVFMYFLRCSHWALYISSLVNDDKASR